MKLVVGMEFYLLDILLKFCLFCLVYWWKEAKGGVSLVCLFFKRKHWSNDNMLSKEQGQSSEFSYWLLYLWVLDLRSYTAGGFFTTEPWGKPSWSWGKTKSWGRESSGSTRRFAELLGSWSSRLGWGSEPRSPMGLCIHNQRRGTPFQTHCQSTLLHLSLPTHCLHRNQSPRRQCLIPGSKPHGCLREEREGLASCAAASDSTQRGFMKRGPGADKRDLGWCNHTHTAKHTHTHNKALV